MTTLLLIRHGQSEANLEEIFAGQINPALTEKGIEQAELTARYIADNYKVDKIYSSDLQRAHQTALQLAKIIGKDVIKSIKLREIYAGKWEGVKFLELKEKFKDCKMSLKQMLLSQEFIAGVGNIYADEIAFKLSLLPTTPVKDLSLSQCDELIKETRIVLAKAIELGGSTIKSYHAANNVDGKFQNELLVYGKGGEQNI